jgi:phosphate butyryltransferase
MVITKLEQMLDKLRNAPKMRLVAAWAVDSHTIAAVSEAIDKGLIDGTLVGDQSMIEKICAEKRIDIQKFHVVHQASDTLSAEKAVDLINKGEGNILMKGNISSDKYMKAILNKERGLMDQGAILSHVTVIENPAYHKLLFASDAAIIPLPDIKQKLAIANYLITAAKSFGIEQPKLAVIAASEQVLPGMTACVDAAMISKMAERGQIKGALVDGPLALDVAIDKESATIKGVTGEVAGDADCLLFPNIESGNVFYKTNAKLSGGEQGAIVVGARVPAVLSSRGDSKMTKLYSIAFAALVASR